jgi:beta-glucosidase
MAQPVSSTPFRSSNNERLVFPPGFLWGAATSAHQVEGQNRNTDWWRSEQAGLVPEQSGDAADHWNRYPGDILLMHELGLNMYRFSVEWARIEPRPGQFDQSALDHYRRLIDTLLGCGIEPLVTLHHFTNPLWLADRGGWHAPDVVGRFADYADRVARQLCDVARWWITVNEPSVAGSMGYIDGGWPPHRRGNLAGYARHVGASLRGHVAARAALRSHRDDALVGAALAFHPLSPLRRLHPGDHLATLLARWFGERKILVDLAPHLDWVGVNYYFRARIKMLWPPRTAFAQLEPGPGDKSDFGWEIYPQGLFDVLVQVARFGKPVLITENGIADADDDQRPGYILEHLRQAHRAVRHGLDLRGYIHWSLLDNFEWAQGFSKRFGLLHVDFHTQERTARPSARLYSKIAMENAIHAGGASC